MRVSSPIPAQTADALSTDEAALSVRTPVAFLDQQIDPATIFADHALLMESSVLVNVVMRAPWWPRGLGVRIDDVLRCNCEPTGGANRWITIRHADGRWDNEVGAWQRTGAHTSTAMLNVLMHAIRSEAAGMNAATMASMPEDGDALRMGFWTLEELADRARHVVERLPSRGRLQPNEHITVARPLTVRDSKDKTVSMLLGQIAGALGPWLQDRFLWERPIALEAGLKRRLLQLLEKAPNGVVWWLQANVAGDRIDVRFVDGLRAARETVLTLSPGLSHTAMWSLMDASEQPIKTLSRYHDLIESPAGDMRLSFEAPAGADPVRLLENVHPNGRILVAGHGKRSRAFDGTTAYSTDLVGDLSPEALADGLIQRGLRPDFAGTLVLFACEGASGAASTAERSYAERLRVVLAARGYHRLGITAFPGLARQHHTHPEVFPSETLRDLGQTNWFAREALRRAKEAAAMVRSDDPKESERAAKEQKFCQGQVDFYRRLEERVTTLGNLNTILLDESYQTVAVRDLRAHFGPVGPRMAAEISEELRKLGAVMPPEPKAPD